MREYRFYKTKSPKGELRNLVWYTKSQSLFQALEQRVGSLTVNNYSPEEAKYVTDGNRIFYLDNILHPTYNKYLQEVQDNKTKDNKTIKRYPNPTSKNMTDYITKNKFRPSSNIEEEKKSKPELGLLFKHLPNGLIHCSNVLKLAKQKYPVFNLNKYTSEQHYHAMLRHALYGNRLNTQDAETKAYHIAQVAINAMFILEQLHQEGNIE